MLSAEIQRGVARGEREAFAALYAEYGQDVYRRAYAAFHDADAARSAVKAVLLRAREAICKAGGPVDLDGVIGAALDEYLASDRLRSAAPAPQSAPEPQLSTLERAKARMPAQEPRGEDCDEALPPGSPVGNAIISVFIVFFVLLFIWILAGILMDFGLVPRIDLGYGWFNDTFFQLFSLS